MILGDNRADWHMSWIRPADDNTNSKRRNGFDIYGDRFTIRLSENPHLILYEQETGADGWKLMLVNETRNYRFH